MEDRNWKVRHLDMEDGNLQEASSRQEADKLQVVACHIMAVHSQVEAFHIPVEAYHRLLKEHHTSAAKVGNLQQVHPYTKAFLAAADSNLVKAFQFAGAVVRHE